MTKETIFPKTIEEINEIEHMIILPEYCIILSEKGVFIENKLKPNMDIPKLEPILGCSLKILEGTLSEDENFFEVVIDGIKHNGTAPYIHSILQKNGSIYKKRQSSDILNIVLREISREKGIKRTNRTYGVYEADGNKMELCENPHEITDCQKEARRETEPAIKEKLSKEQLELWLKVSEHWNAYEVYPLMGLSAMCPFNLILKKEQRATPVPYLYLCSVPSTGKTTASSIFTEKLFRSSMLNKDRLGSDFRFDEFVDRCCHLIAVNEVKGFDWGKCSATLQDAAERDIIGSRGKKELRMANYYGRASFCFTSNPPFPITDLALLIRILKIPFDATKISDRKSKKMELDERIKRLRPIGWELVRIELESVNYSLNNFIGRIQNHANELNQAYPDFKDARRAVEWGIVYEGLCIWNEAFKKYGIPFNMLSYREFIDNVVSIIEKATFETQRTTTEEFLDWFSIHKEDASIAKSRDETWKEHTAEIKGKKYSGYLITTGILSEYRRQMKEKLSPIDIANEICPNYGLDANNPEELKVICKTWNAGTNRKIGYAVFIPTKISTEETREIIKPQTLQASEDKTMVDVFEENK